MRGSMRRALLLTAAMIIPVAGATMAISTPAFAGAKIECTTISGTTVLTVSGCTGGVTGGKATGLSITVLAAGGTIHWVSGSTTTIGAPVVGATSAKKCPGYVKGAAKEPIADKFTAKVTADHGDGIKVPGKASGSVCVGLTGSITALKALKTS